jgi:hypothetical protein
MGHFKAFEEDALRLLAAQELGAPVVEEVLANAELVSYEYSGCGYFLTVQHPCLPQARAVLSKPTVLGQAGTIEGGFLVFIENGELMLECYTAGAVEIPDNFREQHVVINAT